MIKCPTCMSENVQNLKIRIEGGNALTIKCRDCGCFFSTEFQRNSDYKVRFVSKKVPILQIEDGIVVNEYESIKKASISSGVDASGICRCVNGKAKQAGGFVWKRKY